MICPRCDSEQAGVLATSPAPGCWEVYACPVCQFMWRSTEAPTITDPKRYHPKFKVNPAEIEKYRQVPAIPPRRTSG